MKRTKNRILSVFLSFCMIISCMAGINVTASAEPDNDPVSYLDETGAEQTCTDYITVTEATGSFENGNWYVVNSDVTLTSQQRCNAYFLWFVCRRRRESHSLRRCKADR